MFCLINQLNLFRLLTVHFNLVLKPGKPRPEAVPKKDEDGETAPGDFDHPPLDFSKTVEGSLANTQETAGSLANQNPAGGVYPH